MKTLQIADLFCGAGGTSTGAAEAASALGYLPALTAINHWQTAVDTHTANHPEARHLCTGIDDINPRNLWKPGTLDLLWASPECTHHSNARGGKPINEQSRATAWCVIRWADAVLPPVILVENVPEFLGWGPCDSRQRPIKSRKGEIFRAWVGNLTALGYKVEHRILCAADYGDPTTRRRLFVQAVRGRRRIVWPQPTHAAPAIIAGGSALKPWVAAREIIDLELVGGSIYDRKKPLSPKTLARIWEGLSRFGLGPFILPQQSGENRARDIGKPLQTVTTESRGIALCEPFLVQVAHGHAAALNADAQRSRDIGLPLPTVCEPALLPQQSGGVLRSIAEPVPTVSAAGAIALVEPFLVSYYGTGGPRSLAHPLDTVTSKDRFGLVRPVIELHGKKYILDIRFRMLSPRELAKAQGFRPDYVFTGNKSDQVKQIGNAVPRRLARALVAAALTQKRDVSWLTDTLTHLPFHA